MESILNAGDILQVEVTLQDKPQVIVLDMHKFGIGNLKQGKHSDTFMDLSMSATCLQVLGFM